MSTLDWEPNPRPLGAQASALHTDPHGQGLIHIFIKVLLMISERK